MIARPDQSAAVVVGIARYPDERMPDLRGPVNDARAMGRLLVDRFGFRPDRVVTLLDENATAARIEAAFDWLLERVGPRGAAVFFFAGHGSQRPDADGDESDRYDETFVPFDSGRASLPDRDLTDDWVRGRLEALCAAAASVTAIFDCCHSGTMGRETIGVRSAPPGLAPPGPRAPLSRAASDPPYVLVAACAAGEQARERALTPDRPVLGLLSATLIDALDACAEGDTWRAVMARVASRIAALSVPQTPQLEGAGRHGRPFHAPAPPERWAMAEADSDGVRVALGRLHGLRDGDVLELRPVEGAGSPQEARVVDLGPVACRCVPLHPRRLTGPQRALAPSGRPSLWALADDPAFAGEDFGVVFGCDAPRDDDGVHRVLDGQSVTLRIANGGNMRLWLALLMLDPDDRVTVLAPAPGSAFEIEAFHTHEEIFDAALEAPVEALWRLVLVACPFPFDPWPLEGAARTLSIPPVKNVPLALYKSTVRIAPAT